MSRQECSEVGEVSGRNNMAGDLNLDLLRDF
jgi:hypothetical protein